MGGSSPAGAAGAFFRHDKRLHGEISRLIYALVRDFAAEAAGRPLRTAADEGGTNTVVYRAPYSDHFETDTKVFPAVGFLVEVLQHLPDSRCRLIPWPAAGRSPARGRTYGLYSSRARGTWSRQPHLVRLAPEGLDA